MDPLAPMILPQPTNDEHIHSAFISRAASELLGSGVQVDWNSPENGSSYNSKVLVPPGLERQEE